MLEENNEMPEGVSVICEDAVKGDLMGNAKKILARMAKIYENTKELRYVIPSYALWGGDCGEPLQTHHAFSCLADCAMSYITRLAGDINECISVEFYHDDLPYDAPHLVNYLRDDPRNPFSANPKHVFSTQVSALGKRLKSMNCKNVVIGISGGLDSSLAVLVAVGAFEELNFGKSGIHVYTMPGFGTTNRTRGNAELLCEGLGLKLETISIMEACRQHFKDIGHDENVHDVVFENAQARERTQILMDKANQLNGIVLGTGDMSEIALGWSTYNGDHMSMFGVNAGVPKTTVRNVCRWWAENYGGDAGKALLDIVDTPVSPELLPADGDNIVQKTEDKVGPYELHDFFLYYFVEEQLGRVDLENKACEVFQGVYDGETINKWLDVFITRFFSQAFKRNCAPDGIQVFSVYLSPHDFWMPSGVSPIAYMAKKR